MALQMDKTIPATGQTVSAYVNINNAGVKKERDGVIQATVVTAAYATQAIRDANGPSFQRKQYAFPYDIDSNDNVYIQAYNFLKTLPEFSGAVDV